MYTLIYRYVLQQTDKNLNKEYKRVTMCTVYTLLYLKLYIFYKSLLNIMKIYILISTRIHNKFLFNLTILVS